MNETAKKALEGSIAHWQDNINAETTKDADVTYASCPLCHEFMWKGLESPIPSGPCDGCPVSEFTEEFGCMGTPYEDAATAFEIWQDFEGTPSIGKEREMFREKATYMRDFLIGLRKENL